VGSCEELVGAFESPETAAIKQEQRTQLALQKPVIQAAAADSSSFSYNTALNDAWFNQATNGQGFFVNVYQELGLAFLSWFTFDETRPPANTPYNLGGPGNRWLNAVGSFSGNTAQLNVYYANGGVFNSGSLGEDDEVGVGTMTVRFDNCNSGVIDYDIDPVGQGSVPVERIVYDSIPDCDVDSRGDDGSTEAVTPRDKDPLPNLCNGKLEWNFDWPDNDQTNLYRFQLFRADSLPDEQGGSNAFLADTADGSSYQYLKSEAVQEPFLEGWSWRYAPVFFDGIIFQDGEWSEPFHFEVQATTLCTTE